MKSSDDTIPCMENTESPPVATVELVRRVDAARELNISTRQLDRWLDAGKVISRADTPRPGVWVYREHVDALKLKNPGPVVEETP